MQSMWKGVIRFGLVVIPVRLYVATESRSVAFRQLCREHMAPIRLRRWCEVEGHDVPYSGLAKGCEVSFANFVVVDDSDLQKLSLPSARAIEISEFVPLASIRGALYFKAAYYVEPEDMGRKPYHLLRQALEETGAAAVAKLALRQREHLCALQPVGGQLLINTLRWPDEIRPAEGLKGLRSEVRLHPRELKMARNLVRNLALLRFDPNRHRDRYGEALREMVNAKIDGHQVVVAPTAASPVMDLMEALRASVEQANKQRAARREPTLGRGAVSRQRKATQTSRDTTQS
jgi:DNA end-binding protein Ku